MAAKTFKRKELKYFVTKEQFEFICQAISGEMIPDKFCRNGDNYMIYNLYFDTVDDAIIRHSISKPYYKEKLRLRSYKMPTSGQDIVYLELKRKIGGIVAKRRSAMTYREAMEFVLMGKLPRADQYQDYQVNLEIAEFLTRYRVNPKVFIRYQRMAFFHKEDRNFRVSFDKNIVTRREQVDLFSGDYGELLLPEDQYLMEVKCQGAMPLWFCHLLSSQKIYRTSFSKYGTEYRQYRAEKQHEGIVKKAS